MARFRLRAGDEKIAPDIAPGRKEQVLARGVLERVGEEARERGVSDEEMPISRTPLGAVDVDPA